MTCVVFHFKVSLVFQNLIGMRLDSFCPTCMSFIDKLCVIYDYTNNIK